MAEKLFVIKRPCFQFYFPSPIQGCLPRSGSSSRILLEVAQRRLEGEKEAAGLQAYRVLEKVSGRFFFFWEVPHTWNCCPVSLLLLLRHDGGDRGGDERGHGSLGGAGGVAVVRGAFLAIDVRIHQFSPSSL